MAGGEDSKKECTFMQYSLMVNAFFTFYLQLVFSLERDSKLFMFKREN